MNINTFNVYVECVDSPLFLFKSNVKAVDLDATLFEVADRYCYIFDIIIKLSDLD